MNFKYGVEIGNETIKIARDGVEAIILGLLNLQVTMLLFISVILLGILISLASLLMAEKETNYFTIKELLILILYSFVENFGPRQIISFWRVSGYFNSLKKSEGWGQITRKGFTNITSSNIK